MSPVSVYQTSLISSTTCSRGPHHAEYFFADSEMSVLGFHLRHKLFPDDNYTATLVDPGYSQLIDTHVLATRGGWPKGNSEAELFHDWHNATFDELVRDVKSVADQPDPEIPVEDILFFLYDVAGKGADQLMNVVSKCKRLTKLDGKRHVARLKLNGAAGTTFVSFPKARHPLHAESFRQELLALAVLHKYWSKADKWLVLASFEDSPVSFELFGFIEEPWKYDNQLEQAAKDVFILGNSAEGNGKVVGRNQPCPCGSGRKFKKCHGK